MEEERERKSFCVVSLSEKKRLILEMYKSGRTYKSARSCEYRLRQ